MTIQTLTSELGPQAAGLPGELELASLASKFFALLPGDQLPADEPALLQSQGEPRFESLPGKLPAHPAAPPQAPQNLGLGVPVEYAPHLPHAASPQGAAVPATPYYFLGDAAGSRSQDLQVLDELATQPQLIAQPHQLPGNSGLNDLVRGIDLSEPQGVISRQPAGSFYFLDSTGIDLSAARHPQVHAAAPIDVHAIRRDFPILQERVNGKPLVWLDNAATTHKPRSVIERVSYFYEHENSNIHRAAHELAARATDAYEGARQKVARFLGAGSPDEIIFVRGATEAINLVARTFGRKFIGAGDEIIVSNLEHHANIVPWQLLAAEVGAKIRVIPVNDRGELLLDEYRKLLNPRTKLVSVTQVSNALGTITPVQEIIQLAHAAGARVLIDGAQSVSHVKVDVKALDADFFVFSGHKVFGPTGIGVVYGKAELLDQLPPYQGGGNMIADVTFEKTVFQPAPNRFEAGTGNIADAVGLGAALDYVEGIGLDRIAEYEHQLLVYATGLLQTIPGLRLIGTAQHKASVLSFTLAGYQTAEVGKALNDEGIAVRSGHHCAQPILRRFGVETTVRPSLALYNTCEEIDHLVAVLRRLKPRH